MNQDMLVFTMVHSGTRSVRMYYRNLGLKVISIHAMPASAKHLGKYPKQVTTMRNPYNMATSWMWGKANRFETFNWEEQWTIWHDALSKYHFDEIIIIENFNAPIMGKTENPEYRGRTPLDKVRFAMDVLKSTGLEYPNYYGEAS
jgi:hypothetical protein